MGNCHARCEPGESGENCKASSDRYLSVFDRTSDTDITISGLTEGLTYQYIVQSLSYVEIADNVSQENSISVTCGQESATEPVSESKSDSSPMDASKAEDATSDVILSEPNNIAKPIILGCIIIGVIACIAIVIVRRK